MGKRRLHHVRSSWRAGRAAMAASSRSCCRWSCSSRPGRGSCVSRVAAGGQHSHGLEQGPRPHVVASASAVACAPRRHAVRGGMRVREKEAGLEGLEEPEELMDGNGRVTMAWAKQLPTAARKKRSNASSRTRRTAQLAYGARDTAIACWRPWSSAAQALPAVTAPAGPAVGQPCPSISCQS